MEKKEFIKEIVAKAQEIIGEDDYIFHKECIKNNGIQRDYLCNQNRNDNFLKTTPISCPLTWLWFSIS